MTPQAEAIQSAIEKLEALKAKCMPVTCRTLEDQADSALAAIDVCRRFHEIQADCQIALIEVAADAGDAVFTGDEKAAIRDDESLEIALYDADQWAESHSGNKINTRRQYSTLHVVRGSVN